MNQAIAIATNSKVICGLLVCLVGCGAGVSVNQTGSGGTTGAGSGGNRGTGGGMPSGSGSGGAEIAGTGGSATGGNGPDAGIGPDAPVSGRTGGASGATGGISGGGVDAGANTAAAQLCVDTINMYRATLNLAPYARWPEQEACTSGEALIDSQTGTAHSAFGMCTENAQDECPGWSGPLETIVKNCLAQMWAEGPGTDFNTHGHYLNMSSTKYTKAACGFATAANGKIWAAQNFK